MNVVEWQPQMTNATLDVLARAFAGNPIHLAAFGADSVVERNRAFFRAGLSVFRGRRLVAMDGPKVLGFVHWVDSPECQLSPGQRLGLVPSMLRGFGLRSTLRVGSWLSTWARNDQKGPHSHFGPIGVDPEVQGKGVGRLLMTTYCAALDGQATPAFLETDRPGNVAFYEQFGFDVLKEVQVLGTTTFFMARAGAGRLHDDV